MVNIYVKSNFFTNFIKKYYLFAGLLTIFLILYITFYLLAGIPPIEGDEGWTTTSILGNLWQLILFILRFDIHPPFYYITVYFWSKISVSDFWLKSSSILFFCLSTTTIYFLTKNFYNKLTAIIATCIFILNPIINWYSITLRMYSLITCLSIAILYIIHSMKATQNFCKIKTLVALELLVLYSHAASLFTLFFFTIFSYLYIRSKDFYKIYTKSRLILALIAIPVLLNNYFRFRPEFNIPNTKDLLNMMTFNIFSFPPYDSFLVLTPFLVALALTKKKIRTITVSLLLFPLLTAFLISHTIRPLWNIKLFIFLIPASAIIVGYTISSINKSSLRALASFFVLISLIFSFYSRFLIPLHKSVANNDMYKLTSWIKNRDNNLSRTCFIMDEMGLFWSIMRYYVSPKWADSPFEIQPVPSPRWEKFLFKLEKISQKYGFLKKILGKDFFSNKHFYEDTERKVIISASDFSILEACSKTYVISPKWKIPTQLANFDLIKSKDLHLQKYKIFEIKVKEQNYFRRPL